MFFLSRERNKPYEGVVELCEVPFESIEEFVAWWLPERDARGYVLKPPRMSRREKRRYMARDFRNVITINGKTQILTYMSSSGSVTPFAANFAVGSGYTSGVDPTDTSINAPLYQQTPTGFTIYGNQTEIATYFGSATANGTYTNAGLLNGSGVLMTHTPYAYTKSGLGIVNNYLISQL